MTARLALGTYRCRDTAIAAHLAIEAGATTIDTAPNYGISHLDLAPVLARHPEVAINTKVGFPGRAGPDAIRAGVLARDDAATRHSIAPDYIRWQSARNRAELGRDRLDTLFLHNPERACAGNRTELFHSLFAAFQVLEEEAAAKRIGGYGIATWHGFRDGAFTVVDLLSLAHLAAGGGAHHLTAIQLPVSLVEIDALAHSLHDGGGPLVEADTAGLEVHASAPLHGGELPRLVTPELADHISPGASPAQAALHTVASAPQITHVLLSASTPRHWHQAAETLALPPLPTERLREIARVVRTPV